MDHASHLHQSKLVSVKIHGERVQYLSGDSDSMVKASEMMRELLKGQDVASFLEEFITAEREKDKWFEARGN